MPFSIPPLGAAPGSPVALEISDRSLPLRMRAGGARARLGQRASLSAPMRRQIARRVALSMIYVPLLMATMVRMRRHQRSA